MRLLPLLLPACLGATSPTIGSEDPPPLAPTSPTQTTGAPVITSRIDVRLPAGQIQPLLDGTVRLVEATSDHTRDGQEISSGTIELARGGAIETVRFDANRPFQAWGVAMVVFGASGSYQLSVFPPGAPITP